MKRKSLLVVIGVLSVLALVSVACAAPAAYPTGPVRLFVGRAPGGSTDIPMRVLQPFLTETLGQPVLIENVEGGGGKINNSQLFRAQPDGYSLLVGNFPTEVIIQACDPELPYDILKFVPICKITGGSAPTFCSRIDSDIKTYDDLIRIGKEREITVASLTGLMNSPVAYALFAQNTGLKFKIIPYGSGGEAFTAMLGGHADLAICNSVDIIDHVGIDTNALVTFLPERHIAMPDTPTFAEFYPGITMETGVGLLAPPETPKEIIDAVAAAVEKAIANPDFVKAAGSAFEVKYLNSADFKNFIEVNLENVKGIADVVLSFLES